MKRPFALLTAASILLGSAFAGTTALPSAVHAQTATTSVLSQGTSSAAVVSLQTDLKVLGYFTYPTATGYYGTITAAAVSAFQKDYGLPATGTADIATITAVNRALVKKELVADSYKYIGVPYVWGGASPAGFDCSGFVYFMFTKFGVSTVRTTSENLYAQGTSIARTALQPGDLVFFGINTPGVVSHVGFYVGNNQFISATRSAGIFVQSLESSYWGPKYMGAKRVY